LDALLFEWDKSKVIEERSTREAEKNKETEPEGRRAKWDFFTIASFLLKSIGYTFSPSGFFFALRATVTSLFSETYLDLFWLLCPTFGYSSTAFAGREIKTTCFTASTTPLSCGWVPTPSLSQIQRRSASSMDGNVSSPRSVERAESPLIVHVLARAN
jgi:hypothetical protein